MKHQTLVAIKMLPATLLSILAAGLQNSSLICSYSDGCSRQTLYSPCTKSRVFVKDPLYLGLPRSSCQTGVVVANSCIRGNNIFTRSSLPSVPNTNKVHLKSPNVPSYYVTYTLNCIVMIRQMLPFIFKELGKY